MASLSESPVRISEDCRETTNDEFVPTREDWADFHAWVDSLYDPDIDDPTGPSDDDWHWLTRGERDGSYPEGTTCPGDVEYRTMSASDWYSTDNDTLDELDRHDAFLGGGY